MLGLDSPGEFFITVSPSLSEFVSRQNLEIGEDDSTVEIQNRTNGYFNLEIFNQEIFNVFTLKLQSQRKLILEMKFGYNKEL